MGALTRLLETEDVSVGIELAYDLRLKDQFFTPQLHLIRSSTLYADLHQFKQTQGEFFIIDHSNGGNCQMCALGAVILCAEAEMRGMHPETLMTTAYVMSGYDEDVELGLRQTWNEMRITDGTNDSLTIFELIVDLNDRLGASFRQIADVCHHIYVNSDAFFSQS